MANYLDKSVLATIIYYNILDFPLTGREIFKFLINPERIENYPRCHLGMSKVSPWNEKEVLVSIENLIKNGNGFVETNSGFYFLKGRSEIVKERLERKKIAEEKWEKARRYVFWLQALPYVEVIFASGSLALGHTDKESDLDVLVVAKKGRIWLARLLLILATSLLGVRRTKHDKTAPDKICLNHLITTGSLRIPLESLYNAQTYAHLSPLFFRDEKFVSEFYRQNSWVKKFLPNCDWPVVPRRKAVDKNLLLSFFAQSLEFVFEFSKLGAFFEKLARKIQKPRIDTNLPGRVSVGEDHLEFHPYSVEKTVIKKFNQKISNFGFFGGYQELDSGLK